MLLTSTKNPVVQSAKALLTAKGRREQDAFLCDGEHMTGEALRACPEKVSALFVEDGQQERFAPLLALARQTECAVYEVSAAVLETISQVKTPQGIAAVCGLPKPCPLERQGQKLLLMENVQLFKSGNMVDARIGAGVGSKHQSIRQAHGHTVGHCGYSRIIAAAPAGCVRALQR